MDRDKRWERVEKVVPCNGVRRRTNATRIQWKLLKISYNNGIYDEFVIPSVITREDGNQLQRFNDNDAIIFFNFRPDRAIQILKCFTNEDFDGFERGDKHPNVLILYA